MVHRRKNMLRRLLLCPLLTFALILIMFPAGMQNVSASTSVLFEEDFENLQSANQPATPEQKTFPAGWRLINVDGKTPSASVAYIKDAWIIREDFNADISNHVMFSTSWYSPVGASDDWVWTPLIADLPAGSTLSWRAKAYDPQYPDGYEVRIMTASDQPTGSTGNIGNMVTNSTVIYSVSSENSSWTMRFVDLSAYAGESVYIAIRNKSNDQFILVIDDIKITWEKPTPATPSAPVMASKTDTSITLSDIAGAEYSKDSGATWQDSPVFTGLSPNTSYSFVVRIKETTNADASANSAAVAITTDKSTPATPSAPVMASKTDTSITLNEIAGAEYSKDNGTTWQDSPVFTELIPNTSYSFVVRIKETTNAYASANSPAVDITTDKSTPATPSAPVMASETDTSITLDDIAGAEYSKDNGATWQDSPVFTGLSPNTSYSFVARIKETANAYASANSPAVDITTDKSTPATPSAPVMASKTDTSITLDDIAGAEYSKDSGATWQDSPVFTGLSPNTSYSFVARVKETANAYASTNSSVADITTDKSTPATPSAPVMASKTDTSITLNDIAGAEYSKDNGATWQDSPVFTGLTPNTSYSFVARIKETVNAYASANSAAVDITTDKSTPATPSAPIMASKTDTSITLDDIVGAEYSMDNGAAWQDSPVFTGLSPNTSYSFVARIKETANAYASANSAVADITTDKSTPATPSAPVMASKTDTYITLDDIAGAEYSKDNGATWQDSPVFTGLTPNTSYSFVARIKETVNAYASANSPAVIITTDGSTNGSPDTGDTISVSIMALMIAAFGALDFAVRKRKNIL